MISAYTVASKEIHFLVMVCIMFGIAHVLLLLYVQLQCLF